MFVINGPNTIVHQGADCNCASCMQLRQPVKITALPSLKFQQSADKVQKKINVNSSGVGMIQSRNNVIPISVVIESAELMRLKNLRQARFNYPMLECN